MNFVPRQLLGRQRAATCAALLSVAMVACGRSDIDNQAGKRDYVLAGADSVGADAMRNRNIIKWMSSVTSSEKSNLQPLIELLRSRLYPSGGVLVGQVFQMDSIAPTRFLLVAIVPDSSGNSTWVRLAIAIPAKNFLSSPFPEAFVDPAGDRFVVNEIADLDNDKLSDVVYCVWESGEGAQGRVGVIGFRDGRWYKIDDVRKSMVWVCN